MKKKLKIELIISSTFAICQPGSGGQTDTERPLSWLHVPRLRKDCRLRVHHHGVQASETTVKVVFSFSISCEANTRAIHLPFDWIANVGFVK